MVRWDAVVAAQRVRCAALNAWFTHFPLLGNESQFVIILPVLAWWCGGDALGTKALRHFALLSLVACALNNAAKEVLQLPRPPVRLQLRNADVDHIAEQYGFPSTHAAMALALAWILARFAVESRAVRFETAVALATLHVVHVCFSRLYLGVHSAADLVGGLVGGAISVACFTRFLEAVDAGAVDFARAAPISGAGAIIAACVVPLVLFYPDVRAANTAWSETILFGAVYAGAAIASATSAKVACPAGSSTPLSLAVQGALGFALLGVTRGALSALSKAALGGAKTLKRIDRNGRSVDTMLGVARSFVVTTLTAWFIAGLPQPCHWSVLATLTGKASIAL